MTTWDLWYKMAKSFALDANEFRQLFISTFEKGCDQQVMEVELEELERAQMHRDLTASDVMQVQERLRKADIVTACARKKLLAPIAKPAHNGKPFAKADEDVVVEDDGGDEVVAIDAEEPAPPPPPPPYLNPPPLPPPPPPRRSPPPPPPPPHS